MMPPQEHVQDGKFRTRKELAALFGLSRTTFWRRMKALGVKLKNGMVGPEEQQDIERKMRQSEEDKA